MHELKIFFLRQFTHSQAESFHIDKFKVVKTRLKFLIFQDSFDVINLEIYLWNLEYKLLNENGERENGNTTKEYLPSYQLESS